MPLNISEGWRSQVPQGTAKGDLAGNFVNAFIGSRKSKWDDDESKRRFDETLKQRKQEFDFENPALPSGEGAVPSWRGDEDNTMNGPGAATGVSMPAMVNGQKTEPTVGATGWDGQPKGNWMTVTAANFKTPAEVFAEIRKSPDVSSASKVIGRVAEQHPDWLTNKTFNRFLGEALKTPEASQRAKDSEQRLTISKQLADSRSLAAQLAVKDGADFQKRLGTIDAESRAQIKAMSPNQDGSISAEQWRAVALAEEAAGLKLKNERDTAEIEAKLRGDDQRTTITEKGVTKVFTPEKIESRGGGEPVSIEEPDGTKIFYRPGGTGMHVITPKGETKEPSAEQLFRMGTKLAEFEDTALRTEGTNMLMRAVEKARGGKGAPAAKAAAPATAAPAPSPSPSAPKPASTNEVVRVTGDGKRAVFDAGTKQFLRYAN